MCAGIVCRYRLAKSNRIQALVWCTMTLFVPDLSQFCPASFFDFQFQTEPALSRLADPVPNPGSPQFHKPVREPKS